MPATMQIIIILATLIGVIVNIVLLIKNALNTGMFVGEVKANLKNIDDKYENITKEIEKINNRLINHIPTELNQMRLQMHEYSKVIDNIDKRLLRVEIMLTNEVK